MFFRQTGIAGTSTFVIKNPKDSKEDMLITNLLLHLLCDATVATRIFFFLYENISGNYLTYYGCQEVCTASESKYFNMVYGLGQAKFIVGGNVVEPLLNNLLRPGDSLTISVLNGQAGDGWSINCRARFVKQRSGFGGNL